MAPSPVDLLVFGPHPDDIEIGLGGTVARHAAEGYRVGLCDLSGGELGTNGSVEERIAEAEAARVVLGADWRVNLRMADRGIGTGAGDLGLVVDLVRAARPRTVAVPYWADRHPDHVAASRFLTEAIFSAGLRRWPAAGEAWKPERVCYYFINDGATPSFVVDVSAHYDAKRRALACHRTQFAPVDGTATRLTSSRFTQLIESRDAQFGALAGVDFAEGLVVRDPLLLPNVLPDLGRPRVGEPGR